MHMDKFSNGVPKVVISEQPSSSVRFRYECEGRSAGSIPGISSVTPDRRTYPSIQLNNFQGRIHVTVSCVTATDKPKAHPHSLVGKNCSDGVCQFYHDHPMNGIIEFPGLGIQCARRKERKEALMKRKQMNIDPFRSGFDHADQAIDVTQVRLCFQVLLQTTVDGQQKWIPIKPAVTHVIYDRRSVSELNIARISRCSGSVKGGDEIYILCDKVSKDNIAVRFYEEQNGATCWMESAEISFVHKQVAMIVKTPPYKNENIEKSVEVKMKLYRPSDKEESTPVPYRYYGFFDDFSDKRKKQKIEGLESFPPKLSPAIPEPRVFKQPNRGAMVQTAQDRGEIRDSSAVKHEGEPSSCDIPYIEQQPGYPFSQPMLPCQPFNDVLSINSQFSPVATQSFLLATSSTAPIQQSTMVASSTTQSFAHNALNAPLSAQLLSHLSPAATQTFPLAVSSTAMNLQSRVFAPITTQAFMQSSLPAAPTKQALGVNDTQDLGVRSAEDNSSLPNLELDECCLSGMSALSLDEDRTDGGIQAEQMSIGTLSSLPQTGNSIEWLSRTVQQIREDYCEGAKPMNGQSALDG